MDRAHTISSFPDSSTGGTLLALAWSLEGEEDAIIEALEEGYRLTGNFRGCESEMLVTARSADL